ncbi:MAG: penicillin-binding protein, partial [Terriglobia bacterium]
MPAKPKESFPARIFILSSFFLIWSVLLASRFVHLQIFQYADLSAKAERQQSRSFEISPQRGTIYDRRGRELAVSVNVESVYAIASEIAD